MDIEEEFIYGCDICSEAKLWDKEIVWLTSSYGLCQNCYDSLTEREREALRDFYE